MCLIWQGLLQQYVCICQSKQKIKLLCLYARMGTMYVLTWEKQWEPVHVCVSEFQMYSIYQPCYPYIINGYQNFQPYSKQFSQLIFYGLNSPLHKDI